MNIKLNEVSISGTSNYNGNFIRKDAAFLWMKINSITCTIIGFGIGWLVYA